MEYRAFSPNFAGFVLAGICFVYFKDVSAEAFHGFGRFPNRGVVRSRVNRPIAHFDFGGIIESRKGLGQVGHGGRGGHPGGGRGEIWRSHAARLPTHIPTTLPSTASPQTTTTTEPSTTTTTVRSTTSDITTPVLETRTGSAVRPNSISDIDDMSRIENESRQCCRHGLSCCLPLIEDCCSKDLPCCEQRMSNLFECCEKQGDECCGYLSISSSFCCDREEPLPCCVTVAQMCEADPDLLSNCIPIQQNESASVEESLSENAGSQDTLANINELFSELK